MNTRTVTIDLELRVCGDDLQGHAVDGDGASREFSGWLGLICALDALLGEGAPALPSTYAQGE